MKKIMCILLIVSLLICFAACSVPQENTPTETTATLSSIATEPEVEIETQPNTEVNPSEPELIEETTLTTVFSYTVYIPNDNADGFIEETIEVHEVSPDSVLEELKSRNIIPADMKVNSCSIDDGFLTIDFNQAFGDAVCSTGTSGELMLVGSVVNTYLSAFGTDSLYFTVDGEILESGHTVYDFVMSYFSMNN